MNKRAFTLVEVLVVIVILGILAAVAVPKLFGNVAKAKASEIPAAASTYKHVQDAYLGANSVLGNWSQIGYDAPGGGATENFCYSQGNLNDTMSVSRTEGGVIGWGAANTVGLTNCTRPSWWSIVISPEGNSVKYEQNVSLSECASLVLGWKLGTTLTGGCESPSVNKVENSTPAENTPQGDSDSGISEGNNETNTEEAGSTGGTEAEETEETLTTEQTESLKTATSNIGTLKDAYTACTGKTCTKAEKQEKYNAWKEAVDNCNATYGKSNCSANGVKIDDYSDDDIDESHLPEAEQTCTGKNGKSCPCGKMNNGGNCN